MDRSLKHKQTLFYYDVPLAFHGQDEIGCDYVCLLVDDSGEQLRYACTPVSQQRLHGLRKGYEDLRSVFDAPELREFYLCEPPAAQETSYALTLLPCEHLETAWLPSEGLYLGEPSTDEDAVLSRSRELNKPVLDVALDPPESRARTAILSRRLSHFLSLFQSFVKHAYRRALRDRKPISDSLPPETAWQLQVTALAVPGSFTVRFEPLEAGNLFGECGIAFTLDTLDEFVRHLDDPEACLDVMRRNKGHLAGAYLRILKFVAEEGTPLEYCWAVPTASASTRKRITHTQAEPLVDFLSRTEDISFEDVELTGMVTKADQRDDSWKLLDETDGEEYSGSVRPGAELSVTGFVIGTMRYWFKCEEIIEAVLGSGRETKKLYLVEYKVLGEV